MSDFGFCRAMRVHRPWNVVATLIRLKDCVRNTSFLGAVFPTDTIG